MQQLFYVEPGRLEWREINLHLAGDDEALVRPLAVARCDIDRAIVTGRLGWKGSFGLGHETVAEVLDIGDGVKSVVPGDTVIVPFQISCGRCGRCRSGHTGLCESVPYRSSYGMAPLSGHDFGGGLSDLLRVPFADAMLVKALPGFDPVVLAGIADNITDGFRLVAPLLRSHPSSEILIVGGAAPSIALYAAHAAVVLGASRVVYIDDNAERLSLAAQAGAECINVRVDEHAPNIGTFHFTIDGSNTEASLAFCIRNTAPEGLCQRIYGGSSDRTPIPLSDMYGRHITLKTGRVNARHFIPDVLALLSDGAFKPELFTTSIVSFDVAAEAMLEPATKLVLSRDF